MSRKASDRHDVRHDGWWMIDDGFGGDEGGLPFLLRFGPVWSGLLRFGQGDMTDGEWLMRGPNYPRIQSVHGDYSLPLEECFSPDIADIADKSMFAGVFAFSSPDNALTMPSGSGLLPARPPLRTVLESFPSYGSSHSQPVLRGGSTRRQSND